MTPNRGTLAENAGFESEIRAPPCLSTLNTPAQSPAMSGPTGAGWGGDLPLGTEGEKVKCQR